MHWTHFLEAARNQNYLIMKKFIPILIILLTFSCGESKKSNKLTEAYITTIEDYRTQLNKGRKGGYLQLTGLHKLNNINTFGKSSDNDFVFNVIDIPERLGTISMVDTTVIFTAADNVRVTTKNDSVLTKMPLVFDEYGSSIRMYHKHVNWQVITRSGSLYLRVWDEKNPALDSFKGFEFFDLNEDLILEGAFTYYEDAITEEVKSQLGVNANTSFIGKVTFEYNGNTHTLDVGTNGFTMVADETTGDTTYGGGRYIYLDIPKENGTVALDFNKLYNPPCSFSSFTTCLYPPRQNHLSFSVLAGETISSN